jgi:hypothetical protein
MKKVIVLIVLSLIMVTISSDPSFGNPFTKNYIPGDDMQRSISTGGYIFFDVSSRDFYLLDTRVGRLWKMSGTSDNPIKFIPINYEDSKGNLVVQPEDSFSNTFPGRYAFGEISGHDDYMLDTVTGKVWKLQGTPLKPIKLILVPRMDQ